MVSQRCLSSLPIHALSILSVLRICLVLVSMPLGSRHCHVSAFAPQCKVQATTHLMTSTRTFSDVPREGEHDRDIKREKQNDDEGMSRLLADLKSWMPPPPEDQFILTGDIFVLFMYAITSHYLNNFVVSSVISNSDSIVDAIKTLDPTGEVTSLQNPVWVAADQPQVIQSVLTINAQDTLMNHWGPLFSTAGSASVALCTCWLISGWVHRAFLFQNSIDCDTAQALVKTFETGLSMIFLLVGLVWISNTLVEHLPTWIVLQQPKTLTMTMTMAMATPPTRALLTKADTMFLVDSASVLIAWRYMANVMMNFFR